VQKRAGKCIKCCVVCQVHDASVFIHPRDAAQDRPTTGGSQIVPALHVICARDLHTCQGEGTVKLFNFVGMRFCGWTIFDMFVDTSVRGFQILCNITKVNNYFVDILIS